MAEIWIVEDDPAIGTLIEMTVKKAGHVTRRVPDAERLETVLRYADKKPDLLLLDLMLRRKNGYTVLEEWKADPATRLIPVMIISARSAEQDKVKGLELGAEDYITKPFGVKELQARIKAVLRRVNPPPMRISAGGLEIDESARETFVDGERIDLTAREFDLLLYLVKRKGRAVSRAVLLKEVWGYLSEDDTSRTVDSHIKTIRTKLGDLSGSPRFIQTVRGTGYRFIAGEEE